MNTKHTADPVQPFCAVQKPYRKPMLKQHTWIQITGGISLPIGSSVLSPTDFMEEQQ